MRKITLLLLFITAISVSQEKESVQKKQKKHEVKLNVPLLIIAETFDVSYEYLINEESSVGVGLLYGFITPDDDVELSSGTERNFCLTPYYRQYFSNGLARGFFAEGFGMIQNYSDRDKTEIALALGISIGKKYVTKKGFVLGIYLGVGRNLFQSNNSAVEVVVRAGLSVGYTF